MQDSAPKLPIQALFQPRAIALIGVSPKGGAGANILRSGQRFGFSTPTWPVMTSELPTASSGSARSARVKKSRRTVMDVFVVAGESVG